jgi:peptidoglycan/xylan/chitin deacetylase (PgdA/CDA1 family)
MTPTLSAVLKSGLRGACALGGLALGTDSPADLPRVLCYHGVNDDPRDEWSVTPSQLRRQMNLVKQHGTPVSLEHIVSWLRGEATLPKRALAVTFDDGYLDVLQHAAPILSEAGIPGAVFIVSDLPGGGAPHPSYEPSRPLMDWGQICELRDLGWSIGSHAKTHVALSSLSEADAYAELYGSKAKIEDELGAAATLLAYPYGTRRTVSAREIHLAEEAGYEAAFLNMTGVMRASANSLALPRSKVLHYDATWMALSSMRGQMDSWRWVEML